MFHTLVYPKSKKSVCNNHVNRKLNHYLYDTSKPVVDTSSVRSHPAANIHETDKSFVIDLAVPGLSKSDIAINIENQILKITANKDVQKVEGMKTLRSEFDYTSFKRHFRLPKTIDDNKISAAFDNGILSITLNKKAEVAPKQIAIS